MSIKRIALAILVTMILGLAGCGGASGRYDYDSAEGHRRSDVVAEPRTVPKPATCNDYANAREVLADERTGKLTQRDERWLDMDGDGHFCEEPEAEWKGEPLRPE